MCYSNVHTHHVDKKGLCIVNCMVNDYSGQAELYPDALFSLGIHPRFIRKDNENEWQKIDEYCGTERVVAVGECGLDIFAEAGGKTQEYIFIRQIELSEKYRKPMIIHCVKMHNELIRLKNRYKPGMDWIIHGYRGNVVQTEQLLKHGFYLSYGRIFNPESVKITPLTRIFLETDDSTTDIKDVYRNVAPVLNITPEELSVITENNFKRIFRPASSRI
ncbi:MAG: TatD family hydrolase [Candidatus Azobacteroides sp.]|nr:TatD family hydrolase [Candidatus Azobacteroides sp.]